MTRDLHERFLRKDFVREGGEGGAGSGWLISINVFSSLHQKLTEASSIQIVKRP